MKPFKRKYAVSPFQIRYYLVLATSTLFAIVFGPNFINLTQTNPLITSILQVESNSFNDIVFIAIGSFLTILAFSRKGVSTFSGYIITLILTLYIIARFSETKSFFAYYFTLPSVAYADFIFIFLAVLLVKVILPGRAPSVSDGSNDIAINDVSIESVELDEFGFASIVEDLASFVRNNRPKATRTIGIHGKWGSGKTSFINLLREALENDKVRFVNFAPWKKSNQPFATQLLSELIDATNSDETALRHEIAAYSELLKDISPLGKLLQWFIPSPTHRPIRARRLKESINKHLLGSDTTFIVIVDDLDRLTGQELLDVLKLIRNNTDFSGLYYLLAYDRIEVNRNLAYQGIYNTSYLDKFVELEIGLPHVSSMHLGSFLVKHIELGMNEEAKQGLKESLFGLAKTEFDFGVFVATPRDAKRLALSANVFYHRVQEDINPHDAILIQMLRMRFPDWLELFVRGRDRFLTPEKNYGPRGPLILRKADNRRVIESAIGSENSIYNRSERDKEQFLHVLDTLFPVQHWPVGEHYNSVCYPESFYRYFSYYLDHGSVSEIEYNLIITDEESPTIIAKRLIENGQERSLCLRMQHGATRENRWRIIEILFALGRASTPTDGVNRWSVGPGGSTTWLRTQLSRYNFNDDGNIPTEEKQRFIELLKNGVFPFVFERNLLNDLYNHMSGDDFIISREEIKHQIITYINHIIGHESTWNHTVYMAIADCHVREWVQIRPSTHQPKDAWLPETITILNAVRAKFGADAYCSWFIEHNPFPDAKAQWKIHSGASELFGGWEAFGNHIKSLEPSEPVQELLELYNKCKATEFSQWVEFHPKVLSIV